MELPFLHKELYREYCCARPRVCCSMAHPAVVSLTSRLWPTRWPQNGRGPRRDAHEAKSRPPQHQGPELLNKFVGETERHVRLIPTAREKASEGTR